MMDADGAIGASPETIASLAADERNQGRRRSARTGTPRAHLIKERGDDLYQTPVEAVAALAECEDLPANIWECACGPGAIVAELRARGHAVYATNLVDYGCPDSFARRDFLLEDKAPEGFDTILTNPPYGLANNFVARSRALVSKTIMLMPLRFLASVRRTDILEAGDLARVHVFRERLPRMHREGWAGKKTGSQIDFAWFVWDRHHQGPTTIDRISCRKAKPETDGDKALIGKTKDLFAAIVDVAHQTS